MPPREKLKSKEWHMLKQGKTVQIRAEMNRFNTEGLEVSLVAKPLFINDQFKGAVLARVSRQRGRADDQPGQPLYDLRDHQHPYHHDSAELAFI